MCGVWLSCMGIVGAIYVQGAVIVLGIGAGYISVILICVGVVILSDIVGAIYVWSVVILSGIGAGYILIMLICFDAIMLVGIGTVYVLVLVILAVVRCGCADRCRCG